MEILLGAKQVQALFWAGVAVLVVAIGVALFMGHDDRPWAYVLLLALAANVGFAMMSPLRETFSRGYKTLPANYLLSVVFLSMAYWLGQLIDEII